MLQHYSIRNRSQFLLSGKCKAGCLVLHHITLRYCSALLPAAAVLEHAVVGALALRGNLLRIWQVILHAFVHNNPMQYAQRKLSTCYVGLVFRILSAAVTLVLE